MEIEFKMINGKLHFYMLDSRTYMFEWMPCYPVLTITDADYYPLPE